MGVVDADQKLVEVDAGRRGCCTLVLHCLGPPRSSLGRPLDRAASWRLQDPRPDRPSRKVGVQSSSAY